MKFFGRLSPRGEHIGTSCLDFGNYPFSGVCNEEESVWERGCNLYPTTDIADFLAVPQMYMSTLERNAKLMACIAPKLCPLAQTQRHSHPDAHQAEASSLLTKLHRHLLKYGHAWIVVF